MNPRPKRLPRLWCALQGLLPWESGASATRPGPAWLRTDVLPGSGRGSTVVGRDTGSDPAVGIVDVKVESVRWYGR